MLTIQNYFPGQKATIFLETLDGSSQRADGYALPVILRVIFPDLSLAENFPQPMVKLDTGLYFFQFTLPYTSSSVGSYLVDGYYYDPDTDNPLTTLYHIVVNTPFGNFSVTTG